MNLQAQHNHNAQNYRIDSGSSSKGNKKIATRDSIADHRATEERVNRREIANFSLSICL